VISIQLFFLVLGTTRFGVRGPGHAAKRGALQRRLSRGFCPTPLPGTQREVREARRCTHQRKDPDHGVTAKLWGNLAAMPKQTESPGGRLGGASEPRRGRSCGRRHWRRAPRPTRGTAPSSWRCPWAPAMGWVGTSSSLGNYPPLGKLSGGRGVLHDQSCHPPPSEVVEGPCPTEVVK